jgi:hypothetical protein
MTLPIGAACHANRGIPSRQGDSIGCLDGNSEEVWNARAFSADHRECWALRDSNSAQRSVIHRAIDANHEGISTTFANQASNG